MTPLDDLEPPIEPLDQGGTLLVQLAAAVDYLRRGLRPGFTVWDAVEEALRWQTELESDWGAADPLARTLMATLAQTNMTAAESISKAIRNWLSAASEAFNQSEPWSTV